MCHMCFDMFIKVSLESANKMKISFDEMLSCFIHAEIYLNVKYEFIL